MQLALSFRSMSSFVPSLQQQQPIPAQRAQRHLLQVGLGSCRLQWPSRPLPKVPCSRGLLMLQVGRGGAVQKPGQAPAETRSRGVSFLQGKVARGLPPLLHDVVVHISFAASLLAMTQMPTSGNTVGFRNFIVFFWKRLWRDEILNVSPRLGGRNINFNPGIETLVV